MADSFLDSLHTFMNYIIFYWSHLFTLFRLNHSYTQITLASYLRSQNPVMLSKNKWRKKWYFVTKIVLTYCSSDRENVLKFVAEGREFAKTLRSLEQFVRTVKGQNNFW